MKLTYKIQFFTMEELACHCCGLMNIHHLSIKKLDLIREEFGKKIIINSACRCKKHNKEVKGVDDSSHICSIEKKSTAFDIKIEDSASRYVLVRLALSYGFHRIGIYKNFIHIDDDMNKKPSIWYGN